MYQLTREGYFVNILLPATDRSVADNQLVLKICINKIKIPLARRCGVNNEWTDATYETIK